MTQLQSSVLALAILLAGCSTPAPTAQVPIDESNVANKGRKTGTPTGGTTQTGTGVPGQNGATGGTTGGPGGPGSTDPGVVAGATNTDGMGATGGTTGTGTTDGGPGNGTAGGTTTNTAALPLVNPANGLPVNQVTGGLARGTLNPLAGDAPLPAPVVNPAAGNITTSVRTADGEAANYIYAGNTVFVEASGLTPAKEYRATLKWPNGVTTFQDFKADEGGNCAGVQGKFIEYPHAGFFKTKVKVGENNVVTGAYSVEIVEKATGTPAVTIPFAVKGRPILFTRDKYMNERTLYFSDQSEEVYIHGEGFPPQTTVLVWIIKADVNRLTPMENGLKLDDKVFEDRRELTFQTDAKGIIDAPLLAWFTRERVESPLVMVSKFLNSESTYLENEDIAISDHPTFLIKTTNEYFEAINGATGGPAGVPGATPSP